MQIVPDFIEVSLKAKDANWEVDFVVAFKLVESQTARQILKKLIQADYSKQVSILLSNIIYVDKVSDSVGNLTNSFETAILKVLLSSFPYFKAILANYVSILQNMEHIHRKGLQEQNLFEIGKYQYELDYGKQDTESMQKAETAELQESLGLYMNFEDEVVSEVVERKKEELKTSNFPNLLIKANVPYLKLYNIAKLYTNEWGILNPIVLIELAKENNLSLTNTLSFIPLIKAGYDSMKPDK